MGVTDLTLNAEHSWTHLPSATPPCDSLSRPGLLLRCGDADPARHTVVPHRHVFSVAFVPGGGTGGSAGGGGASVRYLRPDGAAVWVRPGTGDGQWVESDDSGENGLAGHMFHLLRFYSLIQQQPQQRQPGHGSLAGSGAHEDWLAAHRSAYRHSIDARDGADAALGGNSGAEGECGEHGGREGGGEAEAAPVGCRVADWLACASPLVFSEWTARAQPVALLPA